MLLNFSNRPAWLEPRSVEVNFGGWVEIWNNTRSWRWFRVYLVGYGEPLRFCLNTEFGKFLLK